MCRRRQNRCGYGPNTCGHRRSGLPVVGLVSQLGSLVLQKQHEHSQQKAQSRFIGPPQPNYNPEDTIDQPWRQPSVRARARPNLRMDDRPPSYHSTLPRANELAVESDKEPFDVQEMAAYSADTVGQPHIHDMPYKALRGGMQMHSQEEVQRIEMRSHTASALSSDSDSDSDSDDEPVYTPATSISGRSAQGQCTNCGHHTQPMLKDLNVHGSNIAGSYAFIPWRDVRGGRYGRKAEKRQRKYDARARNGIGHRTQGAMDACVEAKYARKALRWHRKRCVNVGCWCVGS